jgi:hypothetical protein
MAALNKCDAFLIVLDGVMIDDGSAFELGIAHMRKVPRFGYLSDDRKKPEPPSVNPMIFFSLNGKCLQPGVCEDINVYGVSAMCRRESGRLVPPSLARFCSKVEAALVTAQRRHNPAATP